MAVETVSVGLTMLGFFQGLLSSFTHDKIKRVAQGLEREPLKKLFIRAFEKSLDYHDKQSGGLLEELTAAVKRNPDRLVEIFESNTGKLHDFLADTTSGDFRKKTAQLIIDEFLPPPHKSEYPQLLELLVQDCLDYYQISFLKTMSDREALQTILRQTLKLDEVLDIAKKIESDIQSKIASKQEVREIKELIQALFKKLEQMEKAEKAAKKEAKAEIKGKQIKVLAMTASPKESDPLLYELEQDTLLEVFGRFERRRVFLDMPDPVKSTLEEIREHLPEGKHDILQITAHGGLDKEGHGLLSFEDEEGNLQKVKGQELAELLISLKEEQEIDVKVVILSACHSARRELHLMPTARLLHQAGIGAVVGMKESISHLAAIDFNVGFFQALLDKKDIRRAFDEGCRAVARGEAQRLRDNPSWDLVGEAEIPQLLLKNENLTVDDFSDFIIEAPDRPQSHHFEGAKYMDRGFIGRRDILRCLYRGVNDGAGALVLKGPGGIGKSTITTRAAANLRRQNYEFIVIRGDTEPGLILQSLSNKAKEADLEEADEVYAADASPQQKLNWFLEHYIKGRRVVVIFDNFEENQQMDGSFPEEKTELKEFLLYFRTCLQHRESLLLFSTRCRLAGFETLEVGEFSPVEFRKSLLNTAALKQLDGDSMESLRREVGGNPRALELLDRIAKEEFGKRTFDWQELKTLIPELTERIIHKASDADDFTPLYLDKLLEFITSCQYRLLQLLSLYRDPVPGAAIEAHDVPLTRPDRQRLQSLSLIEYQPTPALLYVHRLTAHHILSQLPPEPKKQSHLRAAAYFANIRDEEGEKYVENNLEARWHYLQAGAWDEAASLTFSLEDHLTLHGHPQLSLHLLTEIMETPLNQKNRAITHHRIGILHQHFGHYDLALAHYNQSMKIDEKRGDDKGVAASLGQIGTIYQYKGDYDAALEHYEKANEIFERIGDIKDGATSLHNIGAIYQDKGDYDAALEQYRQSLETREKIGDIKGVAESLHQIGMIYQERGDYEAALEHYEKAKETFERIGDTKNTAVALHQIGVIYEERGDYEAALEHYRRSLEIAEKIGDIKGAATSLGQIGMIYQKRGDYDAALEQYRRSLEIREKIGDIKGAATSLHQIGMIYQDKGNYEAALEHYEQAKETFERIGDIRSTAAALHQIGVIYQYKGDTDAALEHYQKAKEIFEKIGDIANMAQSFGQMGDLAFKGEDFGTALRYFIRAFSIFKEIGSPSAKKAGNYIRQVREKMGEEAFLGVLKEMGVSADVLAGAEEEDKGKKQAWQFLEGVTGAAVAARQGKGEEREKILAVLDGVLKELPEGQAVAEGLRAYFLMLQAHVQAQDTRPFRDQVPPDLLQLFDHTLKQT